MAEIFMGAHEADRIRGTIGRASDFFGPGVTLSAVGEGVFENILAGKSADLLGDPEQPHTYTYIGDFARALVTLGEEDRALGRVWHVPSAQTLTTRKFVELVAEGAQTEPGIRTLPRWLHTILAFWNPMLKELKETRYQFEAPFVVDHSRFAEAFGIDVTPHPEAIRKTLDWYRTRKS